MLSPAAEPGHTPATGRRATDRWPPRPARDTVDVWRAPLAVDSLTRSTLTQSLSDAEHHRAQRFRFPADRVRWMTARGWLRYLLSAYLCVAPSEVVFAHGRYGKPRLAGPCRPVRFSISHCLDLAVFAVTLGREIGVDVERVDEHSPDPVPPAYLSAGERTILAGLPAPGRGRASLQLWTGKEAYLKGVGTGLRRPTADLDASDLLWPAAMTSEPPVAVLAGWTLHAVDAGGEHVATVAVPGAAVRVPARARYLSLRT